MLFYPLSAHAGFFSFLDKFLRNDEQIMVYSAPEDAVLSAPQAQDLASFGVGGVLISMTADSSLVPVVGPLGSIADVETYKFDQITTYTVRNGDTLLEIADMFGVSVNTILWANDLVRADTLKVGQTLVILPVTGIKHTVKKGDTVSGIAKKYKTEVEEIVIFNGLDEGKPLEVGSIVIVPDAELSESSGPAFPSSGVRKYSVAPNLIGYFLRPIVSGRKTQGIHGYNGVDLADSCGSPVLASAAGDVLIAKRNGWNGGYGRYIVVKHNNGTQTLYSHLQDVFVSPGWHVPQGYKIGTIGSTGRSTGCHVHFEVRGAKNPF